VSKIDFSPGFGYFDLSFGSQGFKQHEQIGDPVAHILIVMDGSPVRLKGELRGYFPDKLPVSSRHTTGRFSL
jgi:hypothetical protein